jgi:MoaA/NifB/PqqE/SkfB family radical SAM enzyme
VAFEPAAKRAPAATLTGDKVTSIKDYGYRIVQLEVTNRCNMACSFCPLPIRDLPLKDVQPKDVFQILDQLAGIGGIDFVAFHQYGEPLLYPKIWECIDRCKELGLRTQLVTNGMLLTDRTIDMLVQHAPNILRLSAQTLNPAYHAATRGTDMSFEMYIERVARCLAALLDRPHSIEEVRTDLAVNEDRYYALAGKVQFLAQMAGMAERGDPTINDENPRTLRPHLIHFLQIIEKHSTSFKFSMAHLDECLERYYAGRSERIRWETAYQFMSNNTIAYKPFMNGRRISQNYPVERSLCGTDIIGILADGTVTCCCLDYEGFTGLGNIFSDDLISILDRNRAILDGLHTTGKLHFEGCKKCLGTPTKIGATIKNALNYWRYS